jgi:hypothetical protein
MAAAAGGAAARAGVGAGWGAATLAGEGAATGTAAVTGVGAGTGGCEGTGAGAGDGAEAGAVLSEQAASSDRPASGRISMKRRRVLMVWRLQGGLPLWPLHVGGLAAQDRIGPAVGTPAEAKFGVRTKNAVLRSLR